MSLQLVHHYMCCKFREQRGRLICPSKPSQAWKDFYTGCTRRFLYF